MRSAWGKLSELNTKVDDIVNRTNVKLLLDILPTKIIERKVLEIWKKSYCLHFENMSRFVTLRNRNYNDNVRED